MNEKNKDNDILLGKEMSNFKRSMAFISIAVIYFFYCYNFMIGTFTKVAMTDQFNFTLGETEKIFAYMTIGTIIGTFIFGKISSKIGKKRTLIIIAISISATTAIPFLNPKSVLLWMVARTITGMALGGMFGTAMPLVADMFPSKYRGKLAAIITSLFSVAMMFGGWIYGLLGDSNWQGLMYTAIIPPIIGAIMAYIFVPDDYEMSKELYEKSESEGEKIGYLSMYKGKYLGIGIKVILLSACNFTAYAAFANNSTAYLQYTVGMTAVTAGSIYAIQGLGQTFGYLFWGMIADKFGRKKPLIGMAIAGVSVFLFTKFTADQVLAFKMISVLIGFCIGFSGAWGAYYTELFPQKYRALSAGMSFNGGYLLSSILVPVVAGFTSAENMMPLFMLSAVVFIAGAVIWVFIPETLNKKETLNKETVTN